MALIFVSRQIPERGLSLLREAGHELVIGSIDHNLTADELKTELSKRPYEGLISLLSDTIDSSVLEAAPSLKIVANYAVGYNNISIDTLTTRGVAATNTPGVLTDSVAEFTIALMLATAKRIPEADTYTRAGKFAGWAPELLLGIDLKGKTLGLVGGGRIGSGVGRRAAHGLGMNVIYNDIAPSAALEAECGATFVADLDTLLHTADVVSLHVPLLPATTHLIDERRLGLMKPTAILINTARGPIVNESALVQALTNKTIRAAGLDVFENEPALAPGLNELSNVVLAPHIASASEETRAAMAELVANNINTYFSGGTPPHLIIKQ